MTPAALGILIACLAGYALQWLFGSSFTVPFALWPVHASAYAAAFEPWQLVTYAFLHGGMLHLFFNLFALYMFGPEIERLTGPKRFLVYYFVCVVTAAVAQLGVQAAFNLQPAPTIGASGGVFGILLAYGMAFPHRKLMLIFPPIPMPAWLFVTLYGLMELYLGLYGRNSNVAHFAHLGGMAGGLALILYWRMQRRASDRFRE